MERGDTPLSTGTTTIVQRRTVDGVAVPYRSRTITEDEVHVRIRLLVAFVRGLGHEPNFPPVFVSSTTEHASRKSVTGRNDESGSFDS